MKVSAKQIMNHRKPARRLAMGAWGALALCVITVSAQAQDVNDMLRKKNCLICHAWDKKLVGPAYSAVRARYSASDVPQLVAKVLNGGSGSWGAVPMPGQRSTVSPAEAQYLVAGILGVSGGAALPSAPVYSPAPPAASSSGSGSTRAMGGGS